MSHLCGKWKCELLGLISQREKQLYIKGGGVITIVKMSQGEDCTLFELDNLLQ